MVLDLGTTPLANDFRSPDDTRPYFVAPLRLMLCCDCSLAQLSHVVDPKILYSSYAYVTSTSKKMDLHLNNLCADLLQSCPKKEGAKVLEIASNTGVFLNKFKGCDVLGVEPAKNLCEISEAIGVLAINDFFNLDTAARIKRDWGNADIIIGRHVFAHIDNLQDLLAALDIVSHADTVIAFEVPYVVDMIEGVQFDTIYHEHLSYVSVSSIVSVLAKSPFHLERVDHYPIHGGCILFKLKKDPVGEPHSSVGSLISKEKVLGVCDPAAWIRFSSRVYEIQELLPKLIRRLHTDGHRIIGYGASAKGNTLLNACSLTAGDLDFIIDNTPFKQGKLAPGSRIPIRPSSYLLSDQTDYAVLMAWNFAKEIILRELDYQRKGGRFILPIPEPTILPFPFDSLL